MPHTDAVPPSTPPYWPSTTKYCPILTQYHQNRVQTWPGKNPGNVALGSQTSAQLTRVLFVFLSSRCYLKIILVCLIWCHDIVKLWIWRLKITISAGWENCVALAMGQTFPIMLVLLLLQLKLSQSRVFLFSKIYIMVKMWYKLLGPTSNWTVFSSRCCQWGQIWKWTIHVDKTEQFLATGWFAINHDPFCSGVFVPCNNSWIYGIFFRNPFVFGHSTYYKSLWHIVLSLFIQGDFLNWPPQRGVPMFSIKKQKGH